jgi:hypothetical protein
MNELIEKLEAAEEGSRELDFYIAKTQGWHGSDDFYKCSWLAHPGDYSAECGPYYPHYTTSLDDARTFVPEGWAGGGRLVGDGPDFGMELIATGEEPGYVTGVGDTPVLALCIVAAKARQRDALRELRQLGQEMDGGDSQVS